MNIRIDKPCNENWDKMTPDQQGRFCDSCSKSVIDFTKLSIPQVIETLESASGEVCGRVSSSQLKQPQLHFEPHKPSYIPYSKVAANVMLIASAFAAQSCTAQTTENIDSTAPAPIEALGKMLLGELFLTDTPIDSSQINKNTTLKGIITSQRNSLSVANAKVEFITLSHVYTAYTDTAGLYLLEIPKEAIQGQNVIRTSYHTGKVNTLKDHLPHNSVQISFPLLSEDYILTEEQVGSEFNIQAQQDYTIMGGLGFHTPDTLKPIVISNGIEVPYKEFQKSLRGEKATCNLQNKPYYYFESRAANALYGEKAKAGLYIFFDLAKTKL